MNFGLPGFAWPWAGRHVQAPNLNVRLVEAPRLPASVPAPAAEPIAPAVVLHTPPARADDTFDTRIAAAAPAKPPLSLPQRETRAVAPAAEAQSAERQIHMPPQPDLLVQDAPQQQTFSVPQPRLVQPEPPGAPAIVAKSQVEEPALVTQEAELAARRLEEARQQEETRRIALAAESLRRTEEEARRRALALQQELEARRLEDARRQAEAAEQERQRALALQQEQEAKRLDEALRLEAARIQEKTRQQEQARQQEEAQRIVLATEALRRAEEAARQQVIARQQELGAQRQAEEAARARAQELAEQARTAAGSGPAVLSGRDLAAKALEQLRSPGALRADLPRPLTGADGTRRRLIHGAERDLVLRMYVENWSSRIERNGALNFSSAASRQAHAYPVVTVAIRSDGSLEGILIHHSSGRREIDEAAQRIARLYAPYSAFPPELARQFDVIEIRRVWSFDETLKIVEEVR